MANFTKEQIEVQTAINWFVMDFLLMWRVVLLFGAQIIMRVDPI